MRNLDLTTSWYPAIWMISSIWLLPFSVAFVINPHDSYSARQNSLSLCKALKLHGECDLRQIRHSKSKVYLYDYDNNERLKRAAPEENLTRMENEVVTMTNAKLDWQRVQQALWGSSSESLRQANNEMSLTRNMPMNVQEGSNLYLDDELSELFNKGLVLEDDDMTPTKKRALLSTTMEVSISAGLIFGLAAYMLFHSYDVFGVIFISTAFFAFQDPLGESNIFGKTEAKVLDDSS